MALVLSDDSFYVISSLLRVRPIEGGRLLVGIDLVFDVRGGLEVDARGLGRTIQVVFEGLLIGVNGILPLVPGSGSFSCCWCGMGIGELGIGLGIGSLIAMVDRQMADFPWIKHE